MLSFLFGLFPCCLPGLVTVADSLKHGHKRGVVYLIHFMGKPPKMHGTIRICANSAYPFRRGEKFNPS